MSLKEFIKSSKLKKIGSEVFWITLGQFVFVAGSVVSVKVLTNLLTPGEYGTLALALTVVGLGGQIYIGPVSQGALRYYSVSVEKRDFNNFFTSVVKLFGRRTVFFAVILGSAGFTLLGLGYYRWVYICFLALIFSIFQGIHKISGNMQNAARNRIIVAWHDGSLQWLKVGIAYLFVVFFLAKAEIVLCAFALSTIFIVISQIYFLKRDILTPRSYSSSVSQSSKVNYWIKSISIYSWPFIIWGVFTWGQTYGDKWLLDATMSSYSVGLYAVLYKIGFQPAILLSRLSNRILAPIIFARVGDFSDRKKVQNTFRYHLMVVGLILVVTIIASGVTYFLSGFIFDLVVSPKYRSVHSYLWLMVLAGGIYATAEIGVLNLMASFDTRKLLFPKITGSVFAVAAYYIGAYFYGIYGLVLANLIYTLVYLSIISALVYYNYESTT